MTGASSTVNAGLRRFRYALLAVALCWLHYPPGASAAAVPGWPAPGYRLEQLAGQLIDEPQALRADLARVVVSEMVAAYAAEAEYGRREAQQGRGEPDLRRWSAAVERLARELAALGETITDTTPIQTTVNRDNSLTLLVDGHPVEVNAPRIDDQAGLERRVIERFCSLYPCDTFIAEPMVREPPALAAGAMPHWSFGAQTGPVCSTGDGLEFRFRNSDDLRRKREACSRVVAELNTLIAEIRRYQVSGPGLDWDALAIHTLPAGDQQRVELNRTGDYFQAYLPALSAAPDLVALLRPWLVAKANGLEPQRVVIDAETLLAPLGFLGQ